MDIKDLLNSFRLHKKHWAHEWFIKQMLGHIGLLLQQQLATGTFGDDPFALDHFLVERRQRPDLNLIAGLQQQVTSMTKGQKRSAIGRSQIARLRAKLAFVDIERTDAMKYCMTGRRHFVCVQAISCSVDNSRLGCMDTMFAVIHGASTTTGRELAVVLPPKEPCWG